MVAIRCALESRERREKGKEGEEESAEATTEEEVIGAEDGAGASSLTWLSTATPELHGLASTRHRHPVFHATHGELFPLFRTLSAASPSAMALHAWSA